MILSAAIAAALLIMLKGALWDISAPFFGAFLISYIANPFVCLCERHKIGRVWGMLLFYLIFAAFVALSARIMAPLVKTSLSKLLESLPAYIPKIRDCLEKMADKYPAAAPFLGLSSDLDGWLSKLARAAGETMPHIFMSAGALIRAGANFIISVVLSVYFIKDTEKIKENLLGLIPAKHRSLVLSAAREIGAVLSAFVRGQLLLAALVGAMAAAVLFAFKIPYAPLLAVASAVLQLVPYFGSAISAALILVITLVSAPARFVWVALALIALQQIESSVLSPRIVGEGVGLHPAVSILAILTGARLFGFWGIFLAVPAFGILRVLIRRAIAQIT